MNSDAERCAEHERFTKIDAAFRAGDLTALQSAVDDPAGFPPLIAALSCARSVPGSTARSDVPEIVALLLSFGCDPHQRGINDYTALHVAVAERSLPTVEMLLESGADPNLRTRIDECETPREMADAAGLTEIAGVLAAAEISRRTER